MERLRTGLNGSEWVGWSYVFYPVTPGTSGRCRGGKERPARPPPATSHESHVLDNALAGCEGAPTPSPGPQVSAAAASFPRRGGGSAAWVLPSWVGGAEAGRNRGAGGGGELVTWANLPQGNEPARRNRRTAEGVARPLCHPQRLGFLSVPASLPPPLSPVSRNCPPWGGTEGRGGCHPMGSGLAAKRRGSRGRRLARRAHLTAEGVSHGPFAPLELSSWAQPAGRQAPTCAPPPPGGAPLPLPTLASQAQKDTGRCA
uniref:uncharacterized protein LOC110598725 n=1 Tax=Ictidomys tridecemlineatus TaxID=43179 RepID=UPI001A9F1472|nr:uncharacterized protein LOC110598725 [Ictidomys tridecemlineatus]